MRPVLPVRGATFALMLAAAAGCTSSAPRIRDAAKIQSHCGTMQARETGIDSVISSTDDRLLDEHPTQADVLRAVGADDSLIAYWDAQPLALPRVSQALGETDGYARIYAAAIPSAPESAPSRRIYLLARDGGGRRWIVLNAFDTQSVCVEGRRDV